MNKRNPNGPTMAPGDRAKRARANGLIKQHLRGRFIVRTTEDNRATRRKNKAIQRIAQKRGVATDQVKVKTKATHIEHVGKANKASLLSRMISKLRRTP